MVNPGFIGKLETDAGSPKQLEDGVDSIHTGIIKALNVADAGSFVAHGMNVTQGSGNFTVSTGGWFDKGEYKSTADLTGNSNSGKSITDGYTAGTNDYYGFLVINGTQLYLRGAAADGASAVKVTDLVADDIPICLIQILTGSSAGSRKLQYYGMKKRSSTLSIGE